ncbi:hypothetical protein COV15_02115 [Candidatus Woesearchaeota archaeon CG10_big_fil_rev_8_21_14_0_10_34_12]|nr:MAG: hypothetical protein COV15_02115 [Candidatus Woesearchaeota archaeon CG10_big_fil_rev_8_21_14_0_10_34_12]
MKSPTKAIDSFWREGFFKDKQKTSTISNKLNGLGLNPGNTTDLLRKRKYLRNKNGFWIQKYPFVKSEEDIEVYYFEPGKPRTSRKDFVGILNNLKGDIKICDPYMNKDTLEALEELKNSKVKFLTSSKKTNLKVSSQELIDFKVENGNVEIKGFPHDHLHDRYIVSNDRLFLLGHGFSIRNKESFVIELPVKFAKDLIQSLSTTFDVRWKNQENIKLC